MDASLIVTKALAIYFLANGFFLLTRSKTMPLLIKDLYNHPAILWVAGLVLIILGCVMTFGGHSFTGTWGAIYPVLGWLTIAKGVIYIIAPNILGKTALKTNKGSAAVYGLILLAMGIGLLIV